MPRIYPCAECGAQMYHGTGALGPGKSICRACRRKARPPAPKPEPKPLEMRFCPTCGVEFEQGRSTQVYCAPACRPAWTDTRVKAPAALRGYGAEHRREREKWKALVQEGGVDCARCGQPIQPGEPWDLDHTDDRTGYLGPSHRGCNRADGGRKAGTGSSNTAHLKWEWRNCEDCGKKCYGVKCKGCRAAARTRALRFADEAPLFGLCTGCGGLCSPRAQWCGPRCYMRLRYRRTVGIPDQSPLYSRA